MSIPRFLVSELPAFGIVDLDSDESKHACNVLRLAKGDRVVVFDGNGSEALATIADVSKRSMSVLIERRTDTNRELDMELELLVALPKGDRQKTLVDALTQLGVTRLIPLMTQRGVARPNSNAVDRMRRSVVETSKQCGRNRLMEVSEPIPIAKLSDDAGMPQRLSLFAHPIGVPIAASALLTRTPAAVRIAVGPEGGFTDAEAAMLRESDWRQVTLGPRILRVETAAIVLASLWSLAERVI